MNNPEIPEDIKNSLIILALDNLISSINETLEDNPEIPEEHLLYLSSLKVLTNQVLNTLNIESVINSKIRRPQWNQESL